MTYCGKVNGIFNFLLPFRDYAESCSRDKSHQKNCWQLITLYLDSTQDVFDHKNKQDLSESKLLGKLSETNLVFGNVKRVALLMERFFFNEVVGVLAFPVISFLTETSFLSRKTKQHSYQQQQH